MQYVFDVLIIILLFVLYGYVHSILASVKFKKLIKNKFGNLIALYRLAFNIFAVISLYFIWELSPKPNLVIYDLPNPFDLLVLIPQILSLGGIIWVFKFVCFKEFLGLDQIKRYFEKNYHSELDEELTLQIEGPYKYSRHPLYFFSIIFLIFRPTMDLFYLTFFLCIVVYFYIGSIYEEKKLVKAFGEEYSSYQKSVPRIFPLKIFNPYNPETAQ